MAPRSHPWNPILALPCRCCLLTLLWSHFPWLHMYHCFTMLVGMRTCGCHHVGSPLHQVRVKVAQNWLICVYACTSCPLLQSAMFDAKRFVQCLLCGMVFQWSIWVVARVLCNATLKTHHCVLQEAAILGALCFVMALVVLLFFSSVLLNIVDAVFMCYALDLDTQSVTKSEVHEVFSQVGALWIHPGTSWHTPVCNQLLSLRAVFGSRTAEQLTSVEGNCSYSTLCLSSGAMAFSVYITHTFMCAML